MKKLMTNWQFLFVLWLIALGIVYLLIGTVDGFLGAVITAVFGLSLLAIVSVIDKFAGRIDA